MNSPLQKLLSAHFNRMDYFALYPATVTKDHGNMEMDISVDSPRIPDMENVPLRVDLPGVVAVKLTDGAKVFLGFEAGEPSQPYIVCRNARDLEYLEIRTGLGAQIIIDDDRGGASGENLYAKPNITVRDYKNQTVQMWSEDGKESVIVRDFAGNRTIWDSSPGAEKIEHRTFDESQSFVMDVANRLLSLSCLAARLELDGTLGKVKINGGGLPVVYSLLPLPPGSPPLPVASLAQLVTSPSLEVSV